jgi:hypothetical protein
MVRCNNNHGDIMSPTESTLIQRLRELPIPAADRARAIAEFARAERLVDDIAELVGAVGRRLGRHGPSSQPLALRSAAR